MTSSRQSVVVFVRFLPGSGGVTQPARSASEEAVRQAVEQCVDRLLEWPAMGDEAGVRLIVFQEQASGFRLCSDVAEALRLPLSVAPLEGG